MSDASIYSTLYTASSLPPPPSVITHVNYPFPYSGIEITCSKFATHKLPLVLVYHHLQLYIIEGFPDVFVLCCVISYSIYAGMNVIHWITLQSDHYVSVTLAPLTSQSIWHGNALPLTPYFQSPTCCSLVIFYLLRISMLRLYSTCHFLINSIYIMLPKATRWYLGCCKPYLWFELLNSVVCTLILFTSNERSETWYILLFIPQSSVMRPRADVTYASHLSVA